MSGQSVDRFPERVAGAVSAFAGAPFGGVLVHCHGGGERLDAEAYARAAGVRDDEIVALRARALTGAT